MEKLQPLYGKASTGTANQGDATARAKCFNLRLKKFQPNDRESFSQAPLKNKNSFKLFTEKFRSRMEKASTMYENSFNRWKKRSNQTLQTREKLPTLTKKLQPYMGKASNSYRQQKSCGCSPRSPQSSPSRTPAAAGLQHMDIAVVAPRRPRL